MKWIGPPPHTSDVTDCFSFAARGITNSRSVWTFNYEFNRTESHRITSALGNRPGFVNEYNRPYHR